MENKSEDLSTSSLCTSYEKSNMSLINPVSYAKYPTDTIQYVYNASNQLQKQSPQNPLLPSTIDGILESGCNDHRVTNPTV